MSRDSSKNVVSQICSLLREETLAPAQEQAREILENARVEAGQIVEKATQKSATLLREAESHLEEKERAFTTSLKRSMDQAIDTLKQSIEHELFSPALASFLSAPCKDSQIAVRLIEAVARGLEKEGVEGDLAVFVGQEIDKKAVLSALTESMQERLGQALHSLPLGEGIEIKLEGAGLTIDVTKKALEEFLRRFIREDFRKLLFGEKKLL
ncbi:MAG: hypothetical protein AAGF04_01340 [Chlamydiota bacterium]